MTEPCRNPLPATHPIRIGKFDQLMPSAWAVCCFFRPPPSLVSLVVCPCIRCNHFFTLQYLLYSTWGLVSHFTSTFAWLFGSSLKFIRVPRCISSRWDLQPLQTLDQASIPLVNTFFTIVSHLNYSLLPFLLVVDHAISMTFAQQNSPVTSSPPHDVLMATRTCNNCGHKDVKQQTVISDENGNKGRVSSRWVTNQTKFQ